MLVVLIEWEITLKLYGHNITIAFFLEHKFRRVYDCNYSY